MYTSVIYTMERSKSKIRFRDDSSICRGREIRLGGENSSKSDREKEKKWISRSDREIISGKEGTSRSGRELPEKIKIRKQTRKKEEENNRKIWDNKHKKWNQEDKMKTRKKIFRRKKQELKKENKLGGRNNENQEKYYLRKGTRQTYD